MRHYYLGALMQCVDVLPPGVVIGMSGPNPVYSSFPIVGTAPTGTCPFVLMSQAEAMGQDLELYGITPQSVTEVFGWGLAAVLLMWSIGYGVSAAVTVIRKI